MKTSFVDFADLKRFITVQISSRKSTTYISQDEELWTQRFWNIFKKPNVLGSKPIWSNGKWTGIEETINRNA